MSNRTLVELNHDFCPGRSDQELAEWAAKMARYMRAGDRNELPYGVRVVGTRHHSDAEFAPWPIDRSPEETLRWIIRNAARPAGRTRAGVRPRWSVVAHLTSNCSTYSAKLCLWAGRDPDELVVRRR